MAKAMGLKTVAEGAETQEAVDFVKAHECDMVQGYFFSPPVPAERLTQMLEQQGRLRYVNGTL
jgi:EAL domain-containing protein (putative c-di-GMP-specific phosphodiesterase class I)